MAKSSASRSRKAQSPLLFIDAAKKRHPKLFLPKLLEVESQKTFIDGADLDNAFVVMNNWADLIEKGHLGQKETALDAEFLEKVFGDALGYRSVSESPTDYHREKQFSVPGAGTADGALGRFVSGQKAVPTVIIELKGSDADLDHDKFNGRTPVQQCWDYLNQLPDTPWGIVSNYVTIRLYHRDMPARAYEEFTITDFRDQARFRQFYTIFERNGLITYSNTIWNLTQHFGRGRLIQTITVADAIGFKDYLHTPAASRNVKPLSRPTISRRVIMARQFFTAARRKELITKNPFEEVVGGSQRNAARLEFVMAEWVDHLISATDDPDWRLLFALARYGGIRIPSEVVELRWRDVDFARGRVLIHSVKTQHHDGHETRFIPIFDEMRDLLLSSYAKGVEPTAFVIGN